MILGFWQTTSKKTSAHHLATKSKVKYWEPLEKQQKIITPLKIHGLLIS